MSPKVVSSPLLFAVRGWLTAAMLTVCLSTLQSSEILALLAPLQDSGTESLCCQHFVSPSTAALRAVGEIGKRE